MAAMLGKHVLKCVRFDYLGLVADIGTALKNIYQTQIANQQYLEYLQKRMTSKDHISYLASVAVLRERIDKQLTDGLFELEYDSILAAAQQNVDWRPLIQAFYDVTQATDSLPEIPEPFLIKGLFDLVWNGRLDNISEAELKKFSNEEQMKQFVSKYIEDQTSCEADDRATGYSVTPAFKSVGTYPKIGTRVIVPVFKFQDLIDPANPANSLNPSIVKDQGTKLAKGMIIDAPVKSRDSAHIFDMIPSLITIRFDDGAVHQLSSERVYLDTNEKIPTQKTRSIWTGPSVSRGGRKSKIQKKNKIHKKSKNQQSRKIKVTN